MPDTPTKTRRSKAEFRAWLLSLLGCCPSCGRALVEVPSQIVSLHTLECVGCGQVVFTKGT